jgi:hypothetical protein
MQFFHELEKGCVIHQILLGVEKAGSLPLYGSNNLWMTVSSVCNAITRSEIEDLPMVVSEHITSLGVVGYNICDTGQERGEISGRFFHESNASCFRASIFSKEIFPVKKHCHQISPLINHNNNSLSISKKKHSRDVASGSGWWGIPG